MNNLDWTATGVDHSLMHGAFVTLSKAGDLVDFWYLAQLARDTRPGIGYRVPVSVMKASPDPMYVKTMRLIWLKLYFKQSLERITKSRHADRLVAIEDYALHMTQGSHQLGEGGGILKTTLLESPDVKMRLHDPCSVKMFAADNGTADKGEVIQAVKDLWGVDFSQYGSSGEYPPEEDLCDAYVLARMIWTEQKIRDGEIQIKDLPRGQRRIFTRMTKEMPVAILERDWISRS